MDQDLTLAQQMYAAAQQLADDAVAASDLDGNSDDPAAWMRTGVAQAYGHVALMLQQMLSVAGQLPDSQ